MADLNAKEGQKPSSLQSVRLCYLDWLRVIATLGVFLYHAVRPFDLQDWLIKNDEHSGLVTLIFVVFLGTFGMALFFFVSGASCWYALQRRSAGQFVRERFLRLFLPFVILSILLHPFQEYLKWIHKGQYTGSFTSSDFLIKYLGSRPGPSPGNLLNPEYFSEYLEFFRPTVFIETGEHLWFLGFLFTFSIIALPAFLWLRKGTGKNTINLLHSIVDRRGGVLLFILPPGLSRMILQPFFPDYTDWSDFTFMLIFFVIGYIFYADGGFQKLIHRDWRYGLVVGVINTAFIVIMLALGVGEDWVTNPKFPGFYLAWFLMSVNAWCWVMVALYIGMRFLEVKNRLLAYGQEAMMSIYLFHHLVIVIIAFYVVQWKIMLVLKMVIVVLASFLCTLAIHEFVVKQIQPLRVLLGIRTPRKIGK